MAINTSATKGIAVQLQVNGQKLDVDNCSIELVRLSETSGNLTILARATDPQQMTDLQSFVQSQPLAQLSAQL